MAFGSTLSAHRRRRGLAFIGRWGGVYGLAATVLIPAAYRYIQRRRHRGPKTLPGYVSTPEYAAPVAR